MTIIRTLIRTSIVLLVGLSLLGGTHAHADNLEAVQERLTQAVEANEISEVEAKAMLKALEQTRKKPETKKQWDKKSEKPTNAKSKDKAVEKDPEAQVAAFYDWLKSIGAKLDQAVQKGELTKDQAWDKWLWIKEQQIGPKLKWMIEHELMTEKQGWETWVEIKKAELGKKLKDAVAKGEITEAQATQKWEQHLAEIEGKLTEKNMSSKENKKK